MAGKADGDILASGFSSSAGAGFHCIARNGHSSADAGAAGTDTRGTVVHVTGREASVAVMLKETDSVVAICSAAMTLPQTVPRKNGKQAGAFLEEKLQLLAEYILIAAAGEEYLTKRELWELRKWLQTPPKSRTVHGLHWFWGLHRHGAHLLSQVVPGKSPGGTAGCISGGGYLQNTAGAAADRADRAGTGSRKMTACSHQTPQAGGDRLCLGHALGTHPDAQTMCCWTTGPHWNKLFIYRPSAVWRSSARAAKAGSGTRLPHHRAGRCPAGCSVQPRLVRNMMPNPKLICICDLYLQGGTNMRATAKSTTPQGHCHYIGCCSGGSSLPWEDPQHRSQPE